MKGVTLNIHLRDRKGKTTVPAAIVGGIMIFSAAAFACTPAAPSATTEVSPTAGARGSAFTASAGGVASNTVYELHFIDSAQLASAQCHHGGSVLATPVSNSFNRIDNTTVRVPRTAARGGAEICFSKASDNSSFTPPKAFTVL
jgi:hypothetical protein